MWSLRREVGLAPEILEGDAVRRSQPELGPSTQLLAVLRHHGYVRSPGRYVKDLAAHFLDRGGVFRKTPVRRIDLSGGRVRSVDTEDGEIPCETVIVAAGVWSGELLRTIGLKIPVQSERGYHLLFKKPSIQLEHPIMVATGKFAATPMEDGLRCAGGGGIRRPRTTAFGCTARLHPPQDKGSVSQSEMGTRRTVVRPPPRAHRQFAADRRGRFDSRVHGFRPPSHRSDRRPQNRKNCGQTFNREVIPVWMRLCSAPNRFR